MAGTEVCLPVRPGIVLYMKCLSHAKVLNTRTNTHTHTAALYEPPADPTNPLHRTPAAVERMFDACLRDMPAEKLAAVSAHGPRLPRLCTACPSLHMLPQLHPSPRDHVSQAHSTLPLRHPTSPLSTCTTRTAWLWQTCSSRSKWASRPLTARWQGWGAAPMPRGPAGI